MCWVQKNFENSSNLTGSLKVQSTANEYHENHLKFKKYVVDFVSHLYTYEYAFQRRYKFLLRKDLYQKRKT